MLDLMNFDKFMPSMHESHECLDCIQLYIREGNAVGVNGFRSRPKVWGEVRWIK